MSLTAPWKFARKLRRTLNRTRMMTLMAMPTASQTRQAIHRQKKRLRRMETRRDPGASFLRLCCGFKPVDREDLNHGSQKKPADEKQN